MTLFIGSTARIPKRAAFKEASSGARLANAMPTSVLDVSLSIRRGRATQLMGSNPKKWEYPEISTVPKDGLKP